MGRAALVIDIEAVRLVANRDHLGAQLVQHVRCDMVGGTVGAVDDDAQTAQIEVIGKSAFAELDVACRRVLDTPRASELAGLDGLDRLVETRLDGFLDTVRQLLPAGGKELDAVVLERIVRCADDDAGARPRGACKVGDSRGRHRTDQQHIDPRRR
jgi:hypothetical protein